MYTNIIFTAGLGVLFSIIGFWIRRTIVDQMEKMTGKIDELEDRVTEFKEEMLRDYVRREDFASNADSHKEIWTELNSVKERVARVESKTT